MPFSIKMSKIFKFNKKIAYDLGMPFLTRPFAGFGSDAPAPKAGRKAGRKAAPTTVDPATGAPVKVLFGRAAGRATSWQGRNTVVSPEALDLLAALLSVDPAQRPSATEALQHPYFDSVRVPVRYRNGR